MNNCLTTKKNYKKFYTCCWKNTTSVKILYLILLCRTLHKKFLSWKSVAHITAYSFFWTALTYAQNHSWESSAQFVWWERLMWFISTKGERRINFTKIHAQKSINLLSASNGDHNISFQTTKVDNRHSYSVHYVYEGWVFCWTVNTFVYEASSLKCLWATKYDQCMPSFQNFSTCDQKSEGTLKFSRYCCSYVYWSRLFLGALHVRVLWM